MSRVGTGGNRATTPFVTADWLPELEGAIMLVNDTVEGAQEWKDYLRNTILAPDNPEVPDKECAFPGGKENARNQDTWFKEQVKYLKIVGKSLRRLKMALGAVTPAPERRSVGCGTTQPPDRISRVDIGVGPGPWVQPLPPPRTMERGSSPIPEDSTGPPGQVDSAVADLSVGGAVMEVESTTADKSGEVRGKVPLTRNTGEGGRGKGPSTTTAAASIPIKGGKKKRRKKEANYGGDLTPPPSGDEEPSPVKGIRSSYAEAVCVGGGNRVYLISNPPLRLSRGQVYGDRGSGYRGPRSYRSGKGCHLW